MREKSQFKEDIRFWHSHPYHFSTFKERLDALGYQPIAVGGVYPTGSGAADVLRGILRDWYDVSIECFDAHIIPGGVKGLTRTMAKGKNVIITDNNEQQAGTIARWAKAAKCDYNWNGFIFVATVEPFQPYTYEELLAKYPSNGTEPAGSAGQKDLGFTS